MVRDNQLSGNAPADVVLDQFSTFNALTGNVYCVGTDAGTNNVGTGNNC